MYILSYSMVTEVANARCAEHPFGLESLDERRWIIGTDKSQRIRCKSFHFGRDRPIQHCEVVDGTLYMYHVRTREDDASSRNQVC